VAALEQKTTHSGAFRSDDLEWEFFTSGGKGGQNQNRRASGARVRHRPSGFVTESREERSQHQNRRRCLEKLEAYLRDSSKGAVHAGTNQVRKDQIGSGMRADKIRTYRTQDDVVTDHRTGVKARLSDIVRGDFGGLTE